jgi:DNA repair protein RecO (recombination protein O)
MNMRAVGITMQAKGLPLRARAVMVAIMEWRDEGVLLSMRAHGEGSAIIEVFTARHGRHLGVVRGGASRKMAAMMQPGSQLAVTWRARLDQHIGAFVAETVTSRVGMLADPLALLGLASVVALVHMALPERAAHGVLYARTVALLDQMAGGGDWVAAYLGWEVLLLEEIGFGLDLGRCAVTGTRDDLAFVSPRTGRAVSRAAAGDWAAKLLPLPPCLLGQGAATRAELMQGLDVTGHFLTREVGAQSRLGVLPEARARLMARLARV